MKSVYSPFEAVNAAKKPASEQILSVQETISMQQGRMGLQLALEDINGDGYVDVLAWDANDRLRSQGSLWNAAEEKLKPARFITSLWKEGVESRAFRDSLIWNQHQVQAVASGNFSGSGHREVARLVPNGLLISGPGNSPRLYLNQVLQEVLDGLWRYTPDFLTQNSRFFGGFQAVNVDGDPEDELLLIYHPDSADGQSQDMKAIILDLSAADAHFADKNDYADSVLEVREWTMGAELKQQILSGKEAQWGNFDAHELTDVLLIERRERQQILPTHIGYGRQGRSPEPWAIVLQGNTPAWMKTGFSSVYGPRALHGELNGRNGSSVNGSSVYQKDLLFVEETETDMLTLRALCGTGDPGAFRALEKHLHTRKSDLRPGAGGYTLLDVNQDGRDELIVRYKEGTLSAFYLNWDGAEDAFVAREETYRVSLSQGGWEKENILAMERDSRGGLMLMTLEPESGDIHRYRSENNPLPFERDDRSGSSLLVETMSAMPGKGRQGFIAVTGAATSEGSWPKIMQSPVMQ